MRVLEFWKFALFVVNDTLLMKKIGIWIDSKEALISDGKEVLHHIHSEEEGQERIPGEGKDGTRFGTQFVDPQKKRDARRESAEQAFIEQISSLVGTAEQVVAFGPAHMKQQLGKALESLHHGPKVFVETADQMTENQKVAWVRNYFEA